MTYSSAGAGAFARECHGGRTADSLYVAVAGDEISGDPSPGGCYSARRGAQAVRGNAVGERCDEGYGGV